MDSKFLKNMSIFKTNTKKNHQTTKVFSYENKNVKLNFTLNVNRILELSLFEGLLVEALKDVRAEINRITGIK